MTMELVDDPPASNAAGTPTFKEYVYFGGQVIAEKDQTANPWTDYIYAAGKKIAKVNPTVPELHIHGTDCASCNAGWVDFAFSTPALGYTIRQGDTLSFLQKQQNVHAGLYLMTPYANTWPYVLDQNGDPSNVSSVSDGLWHPRFVDLSVFAGQPITSIGTATEETPPPGLTWDVYYADVAIQSKDGTVTQVFSGQTSMGFGVWGAGGEANLTASVDTVPTEQNGTIATGTHYYLADELGTTQLEFSSGGWHIWRGEFAPFGQELDTQVTLNRYKFTGKERDTESGLDYFGARYYGSTMGRWMSPDEPFANFDQKDPQSLNLYSYAENNPVNRVDLDGHNVLICATGASRCYDISDDQWKAIQKQIAAGNSGGVTVDGKGFEGTGTIKCGGQTCGTATYHEQGLQDDTLGWFVGAGAGRLVSGLAGKAFGAVAGWLGRGAGEVAGEGGVVIGRVSELGEGALGAGERKLNLPDLGDPKANWAQNASRLREAMSEGQPIRDAHVDGAGNLIHDNVSQQGGAFLKAERNLLESHGWTYNSATTSWYPPK